MRTQTIFITALSFVVCTSAKSQRATFSIPASAVLSTNDYRFADLLRPKISTKQEQNAAIQLYGAGMLDADSIPVGHWNFYLDTAGKHLFCEGVYTETHPDDFVLHPVSSVSKDYDTLKMKKELSGKYPFLKSGDWNYYDASGKRINTKNFPSKHLQVIILPQEQGDGIILYQLLLPSRADEWLIDYAVDSGNHK